MDIRRLFRRKTQRSAREKAVEDTRQINKHCADLRKDYTSPESKRRRDDEFIKKLITVKDHLSYLLIGEGGQELVQHLHDDFLTELRGARRGLDLLLKVDPISAHKEPIDELIITINEIAIITRQVLCGDPAYAHYAASVKR